MKRFESSQFELQFETPEQLAEKEHQTELRRIAQQRESWEACWGWTPVVGDYAEFSTVCATDTDGRVHYVYAAEARILELSETECLMLCLCKVSPANGLTFRVSLADIWPPIRRLAAERATRDEMT